MSRHDKVVGLLLVRLSDVPIRIVLRTPPGEITCWNAKGTLAGRTDPGRQKQLLPLCLQIQATVDTTHRETGKLCLFLCFPAVFQSSAAVFN